MLCIDKPGVLSVVLKRQTDLELCISPFCQSCLGYVIFSQLYPINDPFLSLLSPIYSVISLSWSKCSHRRVGGTWRNTAVLLYSYDIAMISPWSLCTAEDTPPDPAWEVCVCWCGGRGHRSLLKMCKPPAEYIWTFIQEGGWMQELCSLMENFRCNWWSFSSSTVSINHLLLLMLH